MTRALVVDELDLQIVHLLQIAPRITWTTAGEILELSPSAVAARWARLSELGIAWLAVYPNAASSDHITAFVEVSCLPKHRTRLAAQLCADPRALSVDVSAGTHDFEVTVMVADLPALSEFVTTDLAESGVVTATRTRLTTRIHAEGAAWRLDALDKTQEAGALAAAALPQERGNPLPAAERAAMIRALVLDARVSIADLARDIDANPATVRRQLSRLLGSGELSMRCDTSPDVSGWPIECSWLARVPAAELTPTVAVLRTLPQLRLCVSVTGDVNLVLTTVSRTIDDLALFERRLGEVLPAVEVRESLVTLRRLKRMGHLLDADGRATGVVTAAT